MELKKLLSVVYICAMYVDGGLKLNRSNPNMEKRRDREKRERERKNNKN